MKRLALSFAVVLFVSLLAFEAHGGTRERWTSVRSENFTLIGNASERDIRDVAVRLEQYRDMLARIFGGAQLSRAVPTTVIVFKDDEAFKPFSPIYEGRLTDVAGYFQPGRDINYIAVSAERKGTGSFQTIYHELVHLFVDNNFRGLPLCFNEGLAEYFSSINISNDGKKITLGSVHPQRQRMLRESKLIPLQTLLATNYNSDYYNEGDQRSLFYAQSWALVHYLMHVDDRNGLDKFALLLGLLSKGKTINESLKQVFNSNTEEMETALRLYTRGVVYPTRGRTFDQRLNYSKAMEIAEITLAGARAYEGDLLLHINRPDEAEGYLQESLAKDPDLMLAQTSLGMLRVKQHRTAEAIQILRRAATADRNNYLTQYYFAFAISREGMNEDEAVRGYQTASVIEMRSALNRVIELEPEFIEAYRLLAFVNLARDEFLDKAEELLGHALKLSPGRQDLMIILAQIHMRELKLQAARNDLEPILQSATDAKLREQARSLLDDIAYAETQVRHPDYLVRRKSEPSAEQPSTTDSSLQQQAHAPRPWLAKRFKGERVRGLLTNIECMAEGVVLSVKVGNKTLRMHAAELRSVIFVTYISGLERTVTCGMRRIENQIVLTYRLSSDPRSTFDGEAAAIEFVPEDIEIEP